MKQSHIKRRECGLFYWGDGKKGDFQPGIASVVGFAVLVLLRKVLSKSHRSRAKRIIECTAVSATNVILRFASTTRARRMFRLQVGAT